MTAAHIVGGGLASIVIYVLGGELVACARRALLRRELARLERQLQGSGPWAG